MHRRLHAAGGFTVTELLVASLLVAAVLGGLGHLMAVAINQATTVRSGAAALSLAQSRLEELRAAPWTYDAGGGRVSAPQLEWSPDEALSRDEACCFDLVDRHGQVVTAGDERPAVFRRRWAVSRVDAGDDETLWLRVCVGRATDAISKTPWACVSTIKTRKP
ncbi:MAG: type IV pilus modification PilV family protein [Acidobacteriota bacterium]